MSRPAGPIPDSYWIEPGRLCAGEYPSARDPAEAVEKVRRICDAGINTFIDLTEDGEYGLASYAEHLDGLEYVRLSIADRGVPTIERMQRSSTRSTPACPAAGPSTSTVTEAFGRTGTVIACHLVRHGATAHHALASIAEWRRGTPDGHRESPETAEQRQFVEHWRA